MSDGMSIGTGEPYTKQQPKIADRCPACGGQTLFIGAGGWLTCSVIGCKEPGFSAKWNEVETCARKAEAEAAALREVLEQHSEILCPMMYGNKDWGIARTKALDSAPLAAAVAKVVEAAERYTDARYAFTKMAAEAARDPKKWDQKVNDESAVYSSNAILAAIDALRALRGMA